MTKNRKPEQQPTKRRYALQGSSNKLAVPVDNHRVESRPGTGYLYRLHRPEIRTADPEVHWMRVEPEIVSDLWDLTDDSS